MFVNRRIDTFSIFVCKRPSYCDKIEPMKSLRSLTKKHILLVVLFMVYMAEYMLCLICMDQSSYEFPEAGQVFHYIKMPAVAFGFILYPLVRRFRENIVTGRIILLSVNILFTGGTCSYMGLFGHMEQGMYFAACLVSLLSLGFLGGAVYYFTAMGFVNYPRLGTVTGLGGAVAFLIQITATKIMTANAAMMLLLIAGFALIAYITLISGSGSEWMFDEPLEFAQKGHPSLPGTKMIIMGTLAMILLYMICGVTDTALLSMNFAGDMAIYSWPRFLGAAGYVLAGILSDMGRRKWLHLSALCMTILCIPIPFILREGHILAGTCLYYVIAVGQTHFLNMYFWQLAPRTSRPALVAGLSRVFMCLVVTVFPLFSDLDVMTYIVVEIIIAAVVILCISLGGYIPASAADKKRSSPPPDDETARLDEFARLHNLTPRETDFLRLLLESDDDVQSIASNKNISTRTVYRHINSIYEKTGTETRYSLMRYYYRMK